MSPLESWLTFSSLAVVIAKVVLRGIYSGVLLHSGGFRGPARDFITAVAYLVLVALTFAVGTFVFTEPFSVRKAGGRISIIIASTI
jgi:hypothetical protein